MTVLIPAAGTGRRFAEAGYEGPKHLLPLNGKRMIDYVIENVLPLDPDGEIIVATQETVGTTRGAVDTICRASYHVKPHDPLVVANCDQLILLRDFQHRGDGTIFTFRSANPAHSYVVTEGDFILDIREKEVVSDRAVAGVYYFEKAAPFLNACLDVLEEPAGKELYVSEALALMLSYGYDLYAHDVPTAILGTPEDFQRAEVAVSVFGNCGDCVDCKCAA